MLADFVLGLSLLVVEVEGEVSKEAVVLEKLGEPGDVGCAAPVLPQVKHSI